MGLDQFVFKTRKLEKEEALLCKGKRIEDIDLSRFHAICVDELDGDIGKIGHVVECLVGFLNEERLKKEYKIPEKKK